MTPSNQLTEVKRMLAEVESKFHLVRPTLGVTTALPKGFDLDSALAFLESGSSSKDMGMHLATAFSWEDSPQGLPYWVRVYDSLPLVSPAAITQIKVWAISSLLSQLTSEQ